MGSRDDLATAIEAAVTDWLSIDSNYLRRPRLIINLSVGWNRVHQQLLPTQLHDWLPLEAEQPATEPADTQVVGTSSVRSAIEKARCAGALVLAAAGNAIGADRVGPLYPAAWEARAALTPTDCVRRFGITSPAPIEQPQPLVFAVGAVDHWGSPLATTRRPNQAGVGGVPPRTALGLSVTVPAIGGGFTMPYSGTSMSTAIMSAIVANGWLDVPATRGQVIQTLSSRAVGDCGRKDRDPVNLCLKSGANCDRSFARLDTYAVYAIRPGCPPALRTAAAPAPTDAASAVCIRKEFGRCADDHAKVVYRLAEPWVYPQPGLPSCPDCSVFVSNRNFLVNLRSLTAQVQVRWLKLYGRASPLNWLNTFDLRGRDAEDIVSGTVDPRDGRVDAPVPQIAAIVINAPVEDDREGEGRVLEMEELLPVIQTDELPR